MKTKAPKKKPESVPTHCPYDGVALEETVAGRGVCPRCCNTIYEPSASRPQVKGEDY